MKSVGNIFRKLHAKFHLENSKTKIIDLEKIRFPENTPGDYCREGTHKGHSNRTIGSW